MLGAAGLPIYIHAPKFFVDQYGVSLGALGAALFVLRLLDFVQDPLIGTLAEKTSVARARPVWAAIAVMALGMVGLFAITPPIAPVLWFSLTLLCVFSGFSFLTIRLYAQGVTSFGAERQLALARWRETGSLLGVCCAAMAPSLLFAITDRPFAAFAVGFAGLAIIAGFVMSKHWSPTAQERRSGGGFSTALADPVVRQLLILAVLNTAPVAVSSTLFLFFVESRLQAPDMAGLLLILFFISAAISAPLWTFLAGRFGPRPVLLVAMIAAIVSFFYAFFLQSGQVNAFMLICIASGVTLGADLSILPAVFAKRLAVTKAQAAVGFGFWNFASKLSLALAAIIVLPALERFGYQPGMTNTQSGLLALSMGYAAVPCILKLGAIWVLLRLQLGDET
ncbi:MAG: MFS transporter [Paracoccaceae bacterium]|nr:MFS transporter [Paracoccaceae bacterium]